jgi:hypothetical protein
MSSIDSSDRQLLREAVSALREKNVERAKPLFARFAENRAAKVKALVANDSRASAW